MGISKQKSIHNEHDYQKTISREALNNSMNGVYASKITNTCVSKLSNSGAITCACCLEVGNFESHIHSSRVNQHFPRAPRKTLRESNAVDFHSWQGVMKWGIAWLFHFLSNAARGKKNKFGEIARFFELPLSFGAKTKDNARGRERFDIIFDCAIVNDAVEPPSHIRLYVDPYRKGKKKPLYRDHIEPPFSLEMLTLFKQLCDYSWQWQHQQEKIWQHWTSHYIDYFGERQISLKNSCFYLENGERIAQETTCNMP